MAEVKELKLEEITKSFEDAAKRAIEPLAAQVKELKEAPNNMAKITEIEAQVKAIQDVVDKKISSASAQWEALREVNAVSANGEMKMAASDAVSAIATSIAKSLVDQNVPHVTDKQLIFDTAKKIYPENKALHAIMKKDMESGIPSAGGYGVPNILVTDYAKFLFAQTILDKLGVTKQPMVNGNFKMTRVDAASLCTWGGELPSNNKTQDTYGDIVLNAKKLTALVPISNTLLRTNVIGIDSIVSQNLQMQAKIKLDDAAFNGLGSAYQPLGLANTPGIISGSTYSLGVVGTPIALSVTFPLDTKKWLQLKNTPMLNPRWVMNPLVENWLAGKAFSSGPFAWANEMNMKQTLASFPFYSSSTIYSKSDYTEAGVWFGDWSEFIWGVSYDMALDVSREGSYTDGSGVVHNAWQNDETFVRLISEHDFNVRHPTSFAYGVVKQA